MPFCIHIYTYKRKTIDHRTAPATNENASQPLPVFFVVAISCFILSHSWDVRSILLSSSLRFGSRCIVLCVVRCDSSIFSVGNLRTCSGSLSLVQQPKGRNDAHTQREDRITGRNAKAVCWPRTDCDWGKKVRTASPERSRGGSTYTRTSPETYPFSCFFVRREFAIDVVSLIGKYLQTNESIRPNSNEIIGICKCYEIT